MIIELSHQQAAYLRKFIRDHRNSERKEDPRILAVEAILAEALAQTVHDPLKF